MANSGLAARPKRAFKTTTDSNHKEPIAPNILDQDFTATAPNLKWVSDLTYIRTQQGWMYLCVVLDLFTRKVVGWSVADTLHRSVVIDAIRAGLFREGLKTAPKLIFHSDRGSQYASGDCRKLLGDFKLIQSMSRRGNCYDNAVIESFFSSIKMEELYLNPTPDKHELKDILFDYIEVFYNRERLHSSLKYLSPAEFEEQYYIKNKVA